METNPQRWLAAFRRSHDALSATVGGLDPAQIIGPSYCDEWSIAQVLSHLGSQAEIFELFLDAGLEGREPPGQDSFPPIWEKWNDRTPESQASDSLAANEAFVRRLEALPDTKLDGLHLTLFGMELGAAGLLRLRLGEHTLHSWDIAVVLDPLAVVDPVAVDLLVDNALGQTVSRVGKAQDKHFTLQVSTTEPAREFALVVNDECRLEEWSGQQVDGSLVLPAEALLRLVYGRLDVRHTRAVALDAGDVSLDDLRAVFSGI
jgi:uncharacterized protein (TIGR03083 family)